MTVLLENLRQRDPAERDALLDLRSGDLGAAIDFYASADRITTAADRTDLLVGMVDAWVADTRAGHDTFLLAWQRTSVEALNRLARDAARRHGWLTGPDMETSDGGLFAVGDLVVTLAPNYRGQLVTSERAQVIAIDPQAQTLTVQADHGRQVSLLGSELAPDRLTHGYALTVHREQGATSDRTHYYADGGGRELAYVALSRARSGSTVHVVADDLADAVQRLEDDWSHHQHDTWLTPTTRIGHDTRHDPAAADRDAERGRLQAELEALHALAPPDLTDELATTLATLDQLRDQWDHLNTGTGPYQSTPLGRIVRDLHQLDRDRADAHQHLATARPWERPKWKRLIASYDNHHAHRVQDWDRHGRSEAGRIGDAIGTAERRADELQRDDRFNQQWHHDHPEHAQRVHQLERALHQLDQLFQAASTSEPATVAGDQRIGRPDLQERVDRLKAKLDRLEQPAIEPPRSEPPGVGGLSL